MVGGGRSRPRLYGIDLGRRPTTSFLNSPDSNRAHFDHRAFFDGAKLTRLAAPIRRLCAAPGIREGKDSVLVLVNTDVENRIHWAEKSVHPDLDLNL